MHGASFYHTHSQLPVEQSKQARSRRKKKKLIFRCFIWIKPVRFSSARSSEGEDNAKPQGDLRSKIEAEQTAFCPVLTASPPASHPRAGWFGDLRSSEKNDPIIILKKYHLLNMLLKLLISDVLMRFKLTSYGCSEANYHWPSTPFNDFMSYVRNIFRLLNWLANN